MARIPEMLSRPLPASGAASGCAQYLTHYVPAMVEQHQTHNALDWQSRFSCGSVAARFDVDVSKLLEWNPSLDREDCVLQPGVQYCVVKIETSGRLSNQIPDKTSEEPPICTFDPEKGEYDCPDTPPICSFDPQKGEYVCPDSKLTDEAPTENDDDVSELK